MLDANTAAAVAYYKCAGERFLAAWFYLVRELTERQ